MANTGWIPTYRSLQDHWLWQKKPFSPGQAWIDLLMLANYEDTKLPYKGEVITCERGTVNLSISTLGTRWGWSRDKTRHFLKLLESDDMVTVKATTHRTTITIENYTFYNDIPTTNDTTSRQQADNKPTTSRRQADTTNKDNKSKTNKTSKQNIYIDVVPEELREAYTEFASMREKKKKPISSEQTVTRLLNRLDKLADTTEKKIAILHQSTDNNWTDVYPLKGDKDNGSNNNERHAGNETAAGDHEPSQFGTLDIKRF